MLLILSKIRALFHDLLSFSIRRKSDVDGLLWEEHLSCCLPPLFARNWSYKLIKHCVFLILMFILCSAFMLATHWNTNCLNVWDGNWQIFIGRLWDVCQLEFMVSCISLSTLFYFLTNVFTIFNKAAYSYGEVPDMPRVGSNATFALQAGHFQAFFDSAVRFAMCPCTFLYNCGRNCNHIYLRSYPDLHHSHSSHNQ